MNPELTASFVLSLQRDLRRIVGARLRLVHRIPILTPNILHLRSVRRSWEIEIDARFDDNRRRGYENGFLENRIVGCDVGCESDGEESAIGPSVNH
jgi:hypothetical protein